MRSGAGAGFEKGAAMAPSRASVSLDDRSHYSYEREWISEPEYRYKKTTKKLLICISLSVLLLIVSIGLVATLVSAASSNSEKKSAHQEITTIPNPSPPTTVAPPPSPVLRQRPEYPNEHPRAPKEMIVSAPTAYFAPSGGYIYNNPEPTQPQPYPPPIQPESATPLPTQPESTVSPPPRPVPTVTSQPSATATTMPPHVPAPDLPHPQGYIYAFQNLRLNGTYWPLDGGQIASTFGPRHREDCDCYEFHRGVDLFAPVGSSINAVADGKIVAILKQGREGIVLEHEFPEEVIFHPDKKTTTTWYSLYFHVANWTVEQDEVVTGGQILASTGIDHLYHEVRIGTPCDLADAIAHPANTCNSYGYDPHVHPIMVYPDVNLVASEPSSSTIAPIQLNLLQDASQGVDCVITVQTPATNPNINKYSFSITNVSTGNVRKTHILDLNLRTGFDPSTIASIDTQDTTMPYLDPIRSDLSDPTWTMNMVIPEVWASPKSSEEEFVVMVEDVWGTFKFIAFGLGLTLAP